MGKALFLFGNQLQCFYPDFFHFLLFLVTQLGFWFSMGKSMRTILFCQLLYWCHFFFFSQSKYVIRLDFILWQRRTQQIFNLYGVASSFQSSTFSSSRQFTTQLIAMLTKLESIAWNSGSLLCDVMLISVEKS